MAPRKKKLSEFEAAARLQTEYNALLDDDAQDVLLRIAEASAALVDAWDAEREASGEAPASDAN